MVYTPLKGFSGVETFGYTAILGDSTQLTATVTDTVGKDPKASFAITNQISTVAAIGLVRGGLYTDSSSPASPKAGDITALLTPVTFTYNNDFLAKTSTDVVKLSLNSLRGGGGGL